MLLLDSRQWASTAMQRNSRFRRFGVACLVTGLSSVGASLSALAQELKLVPEPKQVERREGAFRAGPGVRIVLSAARAREDRIAAEMLAEEIQATMGWKVAITTSRALPESTGVIYLGRVGDDRRLRAALEAKGLGTDETFDPQGYVLDADSKGIRVAATTGQGLFYGVQTLRQLLRPREEKRAKNQLICPAVKIRDWPTMRWRGVHDDISRGPVPTLEYMKQQIRTIAEYKLNLFALYIEHIFDYQNHPLIAPEEGALTASEVRELVPLFPGPFLHIGADETWELGSGQSKARAEAIGLGRMYLDHLRRVADILKPYHKRLLFWGDIAVRYPELLATLPKEMIAVPWAYDPRPNFDALLSPFKSAGLEMIVAPGASNWNRIFPDLDAALVNIRNLSRDGQKFGALGVLNTTWDDDGESLFAMTWPALVFGAACSWQAGESSIEAFQAKYDWAFYRNEDATFREALANLARAHALLAGQGLGGAFDDAFWMDPFTEAGARFTEKGLPVAHELRLAAEHALASLYQNRAKAHAHAGTLDGLIFAAMRLDVLGIKIQFVTECSRFYRDAYENRTDRARVGRDLWEITGINGRLEDLRDSITRLRIAYADLWAKENRPYWLGNVLVRYDLLASLFQAKIQSLHAAQYLYHEQGALPLPEAMGFFAKSER